MGNKHHKQHHKQIGIDQENGACKLPGPPLPALEVEKDREQMAQQNANGPHPAPIKRETGFQRTGKGCGQNAPKWQLQRRCANDGPGQAPLKEFL